MAADPFPRILPRRNPATGGVMTAAPAQLFTMPDRDSQYLAYIRAMACCYCSAPAPSDPHHVGREGMGQKVHDYRCVPLCRSCHTNVEDGHLDFWESDTMQELELIAARLVLAYLGLNVEVRPAE